jgi:hypothetical protein
MRNGNADSRTQTIEEETEETAKTWAQTIEEEGNAALPQPGASPSWIQLYALGTTLWPAKLKHAMWKPMILQINIITGLLTQIREASVRNYMMPHTYKHGSVLSIPTQLQLWWDDKIYQAGWFYHIPCSLGDLSPWHPCYTCLCESLWPCKQEGLISEGPAHVAMRKPWKTEIPTVAHKQLKKNLKKLATLGHKQLKKEMQ